MSSRIKVYVYREKDPRDPSKYRKFWYCQWEDPKTKKKRSRSTKTAERRKAERFAANLERELNEGLFRDPSRISWQEFRDKYETEELVKLSDGNFSKMAAAFNAVEAILNPQRPSDIDTEALSKLCKVLRSGRTETRTETVNGKERTRQVTIEPIAETTIRSHLAHLRAALAWGKSVLKCISEIPDFKPVRPDVKPRAKGRAITTEEFERMLEAVPKIVGPDEAGKWCFLLRGLWLSGLRLGEALNLWWDRMHAPDDAAIWLEFSTKRPMFDIRKQKSGKSELLPMTPDFAEFIQVIPEERREGRVFFPNEEPSLNAVSKTISRIGEEANVIVARYGKKVKYASAHDLRRSFGSRWARKIMPADLQKVMRHFSIKTTMEFYVEQDAEGIADRLWEVSGNLPENAPVSSHIASHKAPERAEYSA